MKTTNYTHTKADEFYELIELRKMLIALKKDLS